MYESSAATNSSFAQPAPELKSVPQVADPLADPLASRVMSLGGPAEAKLGTFTLSARLRNRSLLNDTDFTRDEIAEVLDTAARLKKLRQNGKAHNYLPGKTLGMLFQHPSTRTRVSFEAGMAQLGGQAIFLGVNDLQMKRGETIADTAQVLSRYVDAIAARVSTHDDLLQLHEAATVPVYNCLTDKSHPLQALADLLTLQEQFGSVQGLKLAYLGDGNNMCHSLLLTSSAMGVSMTVAAPAGYQPDPEVVKHAAWLASGSGATVTITDDPLAAAKDADAIYTDVHVSMGQKDGPARAVALAPYKVTTEVMEAGAPHAVFMHCLPMHRDQEVTAEVADGPRSVIFDQAENRLHLHKSVLLHTLCSPTPAY
jgi:ornithine carbamoyltransferase